jgi:hypothetical protein
MQSYSICKPLPVQLDTGSCCLLSNSAMQRGHWNPGKSCDKETDEIYTSNLIFPEGIPEQHN